MEINKLSGENFIHFQPISPVAKGLQDTNHTQLQDVVHISGKSASTEDVKTIKESRLEILRSFVKDSMNAAIDTTCHILGGPTGYILKDTMKTMNKSGNFT